MDIDKEQFAIYVKRFSAFKNTYSGQISYIERDLKSGVVIEAKSLRNIAISTGQPSKQAVIYDWQSGKMGGIPEGEFYVWTDPILNPEGIDAVGQGIGKYFFSISSDKNNRRLIISNKGQRLDMGIHDNNYSIGSAGCVVNELFAFWKKQIDWLLDKKKRGVTHAPLKVWRG